MNVITRVEGRGRIGLLLPAAILLALNVALPLVLPLNGGPSISGAVCIAVVVATVGLHAEYFGLGPGSIAVRIASLIVLAGMLAWSLSQLFIYRERELFALSFAFQWVMTIAAAFSLKLLGFKFRRIGEDELRDEIGSSQYSLRRLATFMTTCAFLLAILTQVDWLGLRPRGPDTLLLDLIFGTGLGGSFTAVSLLPFLATTVRRGIVFYLPLAFLVAAGIAIGFAQLRVEQGFRIVMLIIFVLPAAIVAVVAGLLRRLGYRLARECASPSAFRPADLSGKRETSASGEAAPN